MIHRLQVLAELRDLVVYRARYFGPAGEGATAAQGPQILALGLSSRKNLCINPQVRAVPARPVPCRDIDASGTLTRHAAPPDAATQVAVEGSRESVDAGCRKLTSSWVRERAGQDPSVPLCEFFEGHERAGQEALLPPGGHKHGCPCWGSEEGLKWAGRAPGWGGGE